MWKRPVHWVHAPAMILQMRNCRCDTDGSSLSMCALLLPDSRRDCKNEAPCV